ncbi:MAG TPA: glycosyltransferase family 2 protein [Saprospiraceae bacterium]|nr:glycosyltransferase family 2 protein [Saprospiraceae bacterium]
MKVSIITPTLNSAKTIADTLESVKQQTFEHIEHIIIDGLSRDETVDIVHRQAPHAICISEADNGIYDAMNKGIRMATGDIIGILNSDDFYANPMVIKTIVTVFETKHCDALYGDLVYVDARKKDKIVRTWTAGDYRARKFLFGWMPPHPTFFVKRSVYEKHGLFDTSLCNSADYELMLRFLYRYRISVAYLPQRLVCMRAGGRSNASLRTRLLANREDHLAWKKNGLESKFYTTLLKPIRKIPQFLK